MILDVAPQIAQVIIAKAEQQGISVDELLADTFVNDVETEIWRLSDNDTAKINALLANPTPPNQAMRELLKLSNGILDLTQ